MSEAQHEQENSTTLPPKKRWRGWRILRTALLVLLVVLLLVGGVSGWMLGTTSGLRFAIKQAQDYLPYQIELAGLDGHLLGELHFDQLNVSNKSDEKHKDIISISGFDLIWNPWDLLSRQVDVQKFHADAIVVAIPASKEKADDNSEPFEMPQRITLPVHFKLEQLAVERFVLIQSSGKQMIRDIHVSAYSETDKLIVSELTASADQGSASINGEMGLAQPYNIKLTTDWTLTLPDYAPLTGKGTLTGDLDDLKLEQQLSGLATARVTAEAEALLGESPKWRANVQLKDGRWDQLVPSSPGLAANAQLDAHGSFQNVQMTLDGNFSVADLGDYKIGLAAKSDLNSAHIDSFTVDEHNGSAHMDLAGVVRDLTSTPTLDIKAHWQGLHYPLVAEQAPAEGKTVDWDYRAEKGEAHISGPLTGYNLALNSSIAGAQIPPTQVDFKANGNLNGLDKLSLVTQLLGGEVNLDGALGWSQGVNWNLNLAIANLQPQKFWQEWPGKVAAKVHSEGSFTDQLKLKARIIELKGLLRGQPLSGGGRVSVADNVADVENLSVKWGQAQLTATGTLADQLALNWRLQVPKLSGLLPNSRGRINASGKVSGTRELPRAQVNARISHLSFASIRAQSLGIDADADLSWKSPLNINVNGSTMQVSDQDIEKLSLSAKGPADAVKLVLKANGEPGSVDLEANAKVQTDLPHWAVDSRITKLDLVSPQVSFWHLEKTATLKAQPNQYQLNDFCLKQTHASGRLCAQLSQQAEKLTASLNLNELPLAIIRHWIAKPVKIEGTLSAKANYRQQTDGALAYDADAMINGGQIRLIDQDLALSFDGTQFQLKGNRAKANVTLGLPVTEFEGGANAKLSIADPLGVGRLQGKASMKAKSLKALTVLVPNAQINKGQLDADLNIAGNYAKPQILGQAHLRGGEFEVPAAGITLTDVALALADDPSRDQVMNLSGQANSGEGALKLSGELNPVKQAGHIEISGQRFLAMDTQAIKLEISPDIKLALDARNLNVGGQITVPLAHITPPDYEQSATTRHSDIVIVDDSTAQVREPPMNTNVDLKLVLGDDIHVDAYGFTGGLGGQLEIEQQGVGTARGTGTVRVLNGKYNIYGQELQIVRGNLMFSGGPVSNPGLDLRAMRRIESDDVMVGAQVSGSLRSPRLALTSTPTMPDNSILSYLLFGRGPSEASSGEQAMLMRMALSMGGGGALANNVKEKLNVDELGFESSAGSAASGTAENTSFYIGKYLSPNLYIKYGIGLIEPVSTLMLRYKLTKNWAVETQASTGSSGGDLIYTISR